MRRYGRERALRLLLPSLALLVLASCSTGVGGQVLSSGVAKISLAEVAKISAQAVDIACGRQCQRLHVYVVNELGSNSGTAGSPIPQETIEAIERAVGDADFVSSDAAAGLFTEDSLVDGGNGVIVNVGEVEADGEDAVVIEVSVTTSIADDEATVHRFEWDGDSWNVTSPGPDPSPREGSSDRTEDRETRTPRTP